MPIGYPGNAITKEARAKVGGGFESAIENAAPQAGLTLESTNYVPRKLDMLPIYPVDASETNKQPASYSLFKNARPGLKYEVPIVIAFGAYPFNARKIAGPSWLTVGGSMTLANGVYTESDDYLTISGTPPDGSEGTYTVTVGVTDQDYQRGANPSSELQISYTLTVSNNMHVFVAPAATGAGDGSSPDDCALYTDLYAGDRLLSFGQGKIAVWRGGNYSNPFRFLESEYCAVSHIAYQDEIPDLDLLGTEQVSARTHDMMFVGFLIRNGVDKAFASYSGYGDNSGFWRCSFVNCTRSSNEVTNQSVWYCDSSASHRLRMFMRECNFDQLGDISSYIWYTTRNTVIERNKYSNPIGATTRSIVFPKVDNDVHCIRRNVLDYSNVATATDAQAFQLYNGQFKTYPAGEFLQKEVCYNQVLCGGASGVSRALGVGQSGESTGTDNWSYRNTYVGGSVAISSSSSDGGFSENDVIQNADGGLTSSSDGSNVTGSEAHGTSGIVDASGKITGSLRTQYLGQRGHEMSGDAL